MPRPRQRTTSLPAKHVERPAAQLIGIVPFLDEGLGPFLFELQQAAHTILDELTREALRDTSPAHSAGEIHRLQSGCGDRLDQLAPERDIQPDSDHDARRPGCFRSQLDENATELAIADQHIVRPLQPNIRHVECAECAQNADAHRETQRACVARHLGERPAQGETHRAARRREPQTPTTATSSRLELREQHFRSALGGIRALDEYPCWWRRWSTRRRAAPAARSLSQSMLANARGSQRFAGAGQFVAAVAHGLHRRAEVAQRIRCFPHCATCNAKHLHEIFAGVKLAIAQLRKHTRTSGDDA